MGMEIRDERGRVLYSTDPDVKAVMAKGTVAMRQRDVPMVALKKFRAPGTDGNVWVGDPFFLYPSEVDHFERNGLARRAPAIPEVEPIAASVEGDATEDQPNAESADDLDATGGPTDTDQQPEGAEESEEKDDPGPTLAKVETQPSRRKGKNRR